MKGLLLPWRKRVLFDDIKFPDYVRCSLQPKHNSFTVYSHHTNGNWYFYNLVDQIQYYCKADDAMAALDKLLIKEGYYLIKDGEENKWKILI
jgi:hypothetical protein